MFVDLSQVHKYEVRGKTYLSDRKKLHTGPAVFRFLVADKIRVGETQNYNSFDRYICLIVT